MKLRIYTSYDIEYYWDSRYETYYRQESEHVRGVLQFQDEDGTWKDVPKVRECIREQEMPEELKFALQRKAQQ